MAAKVAARRINHRKQRVSGRKKINVSTHVHLCGMPEEDVIRTYNLPSHVLKLNLRAGVVIRSPAPDYHRLRLFATLRYFVD